MTTLKYIGRNQPQGMIVEAEGKEVQRLLDSGEYALIIKIDGYARGKDLTSPNHILKIKSVEVKDDDSRRIKKRLQ